ncbi:MAG: DUF429 domain-containing protein [Chromatiales bacterium]|nr:DUF429 domain-containing protein [Chromatiales bacterium]
MGHAAGADGCRGGWLCVKREGDSASLRASVHPTAGQMLESLGGNAVLCIDIPIGLTDAGPRTCDLEARALLGRRGSSVFPAPIRPMLKAGSYGEACEIGRQRAGKALSKQCWAIVPKIDEVDRALRTLAATGPTVREVHPEVCFATWAGHPMQHGKKHVEGRRERLALVAGYFGPDAYRSVREQVGSAHAADDDVLDALAALRTAERVLAGAHQTLPADPPRDSCGLPMEIVY